MSLPCVPSSELTGLRAAAAGLLFGFFAPSDEEGWQESAIDKAFWIVETVDSFHRGKYDCHQLRRLRWIGTLGRETCVALRR